MLDPKQKSRYDLLLGNTILLFNHLSAAVKVKRFRNGSSLTTIMASYTDQTAPLETVESRQSLVIAHSLNDILVYEESGILPVPSI